MIKRLLLTAGFAVGVALAILGVALFGQAGQTALADDADGVITGIDMDPTGNTATSLSSITAAGDHCQSVSVGDTIDFDVWLDDMEVGPPNADESILGTGYDIGGWPASGADGTMPQLVAKNHLLLLNAAAGSSIVDLSEAVPDGDLPYNVSVADFGTAEYVSAGYTQGVLGRYTLDTTLAVPGLYQLTLANVVHGRDVPPGGQILNQAIWDSTYSDGLGPYGLLAVGQACPTGADVKKTGLSAIGLPPGNQGVQSISVPFTLRATVHNNGADSPVNITDVTTITVPAGVQVSYTTTDLETVDINGTPSTPGPGITFIGNPADVMTVTYPLAGLVQSIATNLDQSWDYHCLAAGAPVLNFSDVVTVDPPSWETTPGNNSQALAIPLDCLLSPDADVKIVDQIIIDAPDVKPELGIPTLIVQESDTVGIRKVLHNNGPFLGAPTDITTGWMLMYTGSADYGQCQVVPPGYVDQVFLEESISQNYDESYTIVCDQGGITQDDDADGVNDEDIIGGPGVDNDGDTSADEDSCDGLDNDGDTQIDEDPADGDDDCDGSIDEDSPFYVVTLVIQNTIAPKPGINDPNPANNVWVTPVSMAVIRPFTPVFVATIDDDQPGVQVDPVDDTCLAGLPCKRQMYISITDPPPAVSFPGAQPMPVAMSQVIGTVPGAWWHGDGVSIGIPPGGTIGYCPTLGGEKVGNFDFYIYTDFGLPGVNNCTTMFGGVDVEFFNLCLPPSAGSVHPITGNQYVPGDPLGCGVDVGGAGAALLVGPWCGPGSAEISWSSLLDHTTNAVIHAQPTAVLWARFGGYVEPLPGTYVPINSLIFDLSGGFGVGPWLNVTVLANPDSPPQPPDPMDFCTPFMSNSLILGESEPNDNPILICNAGDTVRPIVGNFTRPIGQEETVIDMVTCIAENDISCGLVKDETPNLAIGIPDQESVDVTINNGQVPDSVDVEVSIVTPVACPANWLAAYGGTVNSFDVGINHFSIISFSSDAVPPGGMMAGFESRVATLTYEAVCAAGTYTFQIVTNMESANALPDPNELNNQCENHPEATADNNDVDGDTVPNADDNCPWTPNPDQADNDGDGAGDACDDDDDNDGIPDASDDCPFTAEDVDGEDDADGCPDSDAHDIVVDKNDDIDVDVSEDHVETVTTTITNGNYGLYAPDGMWFIELLKSDVTDPNDNCEARWVVQPGDGYVEDYIWADLDGDTVDDTLELWSQLEVVIQNVPPYNDVSKTRDYVVHCNARSDHSIFLEEAAIPAYPVVDPDVQNGNVHKQYITIEAWEPADVKVVSVDVHDAPDEMLVSGTYVFEVKKVIHNNGPTDNVNTDIVYNATVPADCQATLLVPPAWPQVATPLSVNVVVWEEYEIHCTDPSDHEFTFENDIDVAGTHRYDPDLSNNHGEASISVPVLAEADLKVISAEIIGLPADIDLSQDLPVTLRATVHNNGGFSGASATVDVAGVAPADCTLTPDSGSAQVVLANSIAAVVDVSAILHCTAPSTHNVSVSASISAPKDAHVSDPDLQNNSASGNADVTVWADADVKLISLSAPSVVLVQPGVPEAIEVSESVHNNGPYEPVDLFDTMTLTPAGDACGVSYECQGGEMIMLNGWIVIFDCPAGFETWGMYPVLYGDTMDIQYYVEDLPMSVSSTNVGDVTLQWVEPKKPPYSCDIVIEKSVDGTGTHIDDPDLGNNSDTAVVTLVRDTDDDGVPDNFGGERDNCQDIPNPDQTDTDGDGLGDVCDPTPDHRVVVKGCFKLGPSPANISDFQGRYMWAVCEIGNLEAYVEGATISLDAEDPPAGCTEDEQLVLPGQDTFLMSPLEQKWILYRVRYECHDPLAVPGVYALTVSICVDSQPQPFDDDGDTLVDEDPIDGIDNDGDSLIDEDPPEGDTPPDCHVQVKQLIVHQP